MKLRTTFFAIAASLSLGACTGDNQEDFVKGTSFIEPRTYEHDISSTNDQCATGQPTRFNCHPSMFFAPDGTGTVILTDIANAITYKINHSKLTTKLKGAGDIPQTQEFEISPDGKILLDVSNSVIWQLKSSETSYVDVFINKGEKQCEPDSGLSLKASATTLTSAGVDVTRNACGYQSGIAFPAVCGAGTAAVNIHSIEKDDLALAQKAGFTAVPAFNETHPDTKIVETACK